MTKHGGTPGAQRVKKAGPVKGKLNNFIEGESKCILVSSLPKEEKSSNPREKKVLPVAKNVLQMSTLPEM